MLDDVDRPALRWRESAAWFPVRRRGLGFRVFAFNRIVALLLTAYLAMHFAVISSLYLGEPAYDRLMTLFRSPPFLAFDVALILALVYHGLDGIRLVLVTLTVGTRHQEKIFWGLMAAGLVILLYATVRLFRI